MNIIKIDKNNMVNGTGLRCVVWCAGCDHRCQGCHNPETWNPNTGTEIGDWFYNALREQLDSEEISGVTFTGGEATYLDNREQATEIMRWLKTNYPQKTIWVYTGYLYEDILDLDMMEYIDVLVDGPYVSSLNPGPGKLKWRGSSNQRVIDLPATRANNNKIVWVRDFNGKFIYENEAGYNANQSIDLKACHN